MKYKHHQTLTGMRGKEYKVIERLEDVDTGQDKYVIHCSSTGESYFGTESGVEQFVLGENGALSKLE